MLGISGFDFRLSSSNFLKPFLAVNIVAGFAFFKTSDQEMCENCNGRTIGEVGV